MSGAARTRCAALDGLTGRVVEIEADIANGLPKTLLVGLPDASIGQARERCRAAFANSGHAWPDTRVTVNLAPSSLPKSGSHYDLAIALAVLGAAGAIPPEPLRDTLVLGELALDGRLRAVPGVLPAVIAGAAAGCRRVIVPEVNAEEAQLVEDVDVVGVRSLGHVLGLLTEAEVPDDPPVEPLVTESLFSPVMIGRELEFSDVVGQAEARISLVVAAAGGHHVWFVGPPGLGKTMLASRLPSLLPDLDREEALEVSAVHSVAGLLPADVPLLTRPPFVDPHHTATPVAIVGGGSKIIRPGALSLAHRGVLFLDEAPEFASNVLEALRQPLESGRIVVSRAAQTVTYPARFQLILASNPCPCGHDDASAATCACTPVARRRYRERLSGPIRDRIDIVRELSPIGRRGPVDGLGAPRTTAEVAADVARARERQAHRYHGHAWRLNREVDGAVLRRTWPPEPDAQGVLDAALRSRSLSPRGADRVLRLSWTIADLRGLERPGVDEVDGALSLRTSMPLGGSLQALVAA